MNRRIGSVGPRRVPEPVPAAPYRVPQVLGQVFQRRQRREQRGLLTIGKARHGFGDHRAPLRRDPLVDGAALRRDLDPGRAKIIGVAQPLEQAVFSSSLPMTRESIVGLMPSSSVSSVRLSGPRMVVMPSTEAWVGVSPSSREAALSCRASLRTTRLRRCLLYTSDAADE